MVSYVDVLRHSAKVGKSVAVIGAGGIGFDISDFLTHAEDAHHIMPTKAGVHPAVDTEAVEYFLKDWGIDKTIAKGGLGGRANKGAGEPGASPRKVYLLQRKAGKVGAGLGKTTGWIHRATLKKRGVEELSGCTYVEVNDKGLVIQRGGKESTLAVDTVVICAGQEPYCALLEPLKKVGKPVFLIGGSYEAGELDAKRAIDQGTRLAVQIESAKTGDVYDAPIDLQTKVLQVAEKYLGGKK